MNGQRSICGLILLGSGLCASPVHGDVLQLTANRDNTLFEDDEGDFSSGAGIYLFAGQTGPNGSEERRRLTLAFDLSAIPAGSVVNSATLELTINRVPNGASPDLAYLHKLTAAWGEGSSDAGTPGGAGDVASPGDATWIHTFHDSSFWNQAGGDFVATPSAIAPFDGYSGSTDVEESLFFTSGAQIVADVQGWVNDPAGNFGWILLGDENTTKNARRFYSREASGSNPDLVPVLTVDYTAKSLTDQLELRQIASGLDQPIGFANAGDGSRRLFVIEQPGRIRIFDTVTQQLLPTPFLDISAAVDNQGNEQGLLGLAFHPDFENNRQFYVSYTRDPGPGLDRSVLAMYRASPGNPDIADVTETVLMEFTQEASNHNGGDIHFGRDGYLYFASGDGGGSNDQYGNAQDLGSLKGKMLRIDVDGPPAAGELCGMVGLYAIPPGNPFTGAADGCDEILFFGLRNPWRFSFDAATGAMYIGDVGQNLYEEINLAQADEASSNFGWSCREGLHPFPAGKACVSSFTDPIIEYPHIAGACSVTGGYVYRGGGTALEGKYIYGDYCSTQIWLATPGDSGWTNEEWTAASSVLVSLASFGQDETCELYVADRSTGRIYRIDDTERVLNSSFEQLSCR
jgi:glucose/arabinose dehydrogenase